MAGVYELGWSMPGEAPVKICRACKEGRDKPSNATCHRCMVPLIGPGTWPAVFTKAFRDLRYTTLNVVCDDCMEAIRAGTRKQYVADDDCEAS